MGCRLRIFSLAFGLIAYYVYHVDVSVPEEFYFKTDDFIRKFGYNCEEHQVVTEDGYILTIFRLVAHNRSSATAPSVPVLLEAGLFGSSDVMVMRGPEEDTPFILASRGFDVWLGNNRGNRYCQPGPQSNLSNPTTYNFGFEEIGVYDFAAKIDYIRQKTGSSQLDIAVVSAGSSSLLALQSLRPSYNTAIRKALHFGSGMALRLDKPYQKAWFYLCWKAKWLLTFTNALEPFKWKPQLMLVLCERTFMVPICRSLLTQSTGYPDSQDNPRLAALIFALLPSGTPLGVVDHLMQITLAENEFIRRDWGPEENLRRYNTTQPPPYDVTNINTYTKSYNTRDEGLVTYQLPRKVFSQMPKFAGEFMIETHFAHINFFIGAARSPLFVDDVISTLESRV